MVKMFLILLNALKKEKTVWSDFPKMTTKRKEFAIALGPDNCIYILGGSDEKEYKILFYK